MLNTIYKDNISTADLSDMQNKPSTFASDSNSVDIYLVAGRNVQADTIFPKTDVSVFI